MFRSVIADYGVLKQDALDVLQVRWKTELEAGLGSVQSQLKHEHEVNATTDLYKELDLLKLRFGEERA